MSIEELQAQMATAISNNDVASMEAIALQIVASKKERAKAEAEKLQKESEQLAGKREALAAEIHKQVKLLNLDKAITDVKGWGFTYKVDKANPAEPDVTYKTVALTTAVVKAHKAGGGGRHGGLQEDFDKVAEAYGKAHGVDIMAELAAALEKDKTVSNQGYSYNVKKRVQKWGIAQGLLQPVK